MEFSGVAQTFQSAVSQVFQPAKLRQPNAPGEGGNVWRSHGLPTGKSAIRQVENLRYGITLGSIITGSWVR
jgi:hypothetical protein